MLKPSGSLIFFIIAASSASEAPVGGPDGGAWPFCASVSSPRNQSGGGLVQKSLVPDSYFFSGFCCALAWLTPATTRTAASARMDRLNADFIASLPMQPGGCDCYYFENLTWSGEEKQTPKMVACPMRKARGFVRQKQTDGKIFLK